MKERVIKWGDHERIILQKVFGPLVVPDISISVHNDELVIEVEESGDEEDLHDTWWVEIYRS